MTTVRCMLSPAFADGPFWGGNAMWGALVATVASLVIGSILSYALVNVSGRTAVTALVRLG